MLRLSTLALLIALCAIEGAGALEVPAADCVGGQSTCWQDRFGVPPFAEYVGEGDEVIRLHVDAFGQRENVYQLVRRPDGSVWLDARADLGPLRTIFYPMPPNVWPKAVMLWARFVKDEEAYRARVASGKENHTHTDPATHITSITVCTDGMAADIEASFLGSDTKKFSPSDCFDSAPVSFTSDFQALVLKSVPYCAGFDEAEFAMYNACFLLDGNKYEAASAAIEFLSLSTSSDAKISNRDCFSKMLHPVSESDAEETRALLCPDDGSNAAAVIEGRSDRVVISGIATRWKLPEAGQNTGTQFFSAPFHEVWQRDKSGQFKIVQWKFGVFKSDPSAR